MAAHELHNYAGDEEEFAAYSKHIGDLWANLPRIPRKRAIRMIIDPAYQKRFEARSPRIEAEVVAIRAKWLVEYRDGARCGAGLKVDGARGLGSYPLGFHEWLLERRNAWYAGFNQAFSERAHHDRA